MGDQTIAKKNTNQNLLLRTLDFFEILIYALVPKRVKLYLICDIFSLFPFLPFIPR